MPSGKDYLKGLIGGVGNSVIGNIPGGKVISGALLGGLSDADFYSFFYDFFLITFCKHKLFLDFHDILQ